MIGSEYWLWRRNYVYQLAPAVVNTELGIAHIIAWRHNNALINDGVAWQAAQR